MVDYVSVQKKVLQVWQIWIFWACALLVLCDSYSREYLHFAQWLWMKFTLLLRPVGLLKLILIFFGMIHIQKIESWLGDFMKSTFYTGLHSDAYALIFFRHL